MIKYCLILLLFCMSQNSLAFDKNYYSIHLTELQDALGDCPQTHPKDITCEELEEVGIEVNHLMEELHHSPQEFGGKILELQESLANFREVAKRRSQRKNMKTIYQYHKMKLRQLLAIVKFLESPKS